MKNTKTVELTEHEIKLIIACIKAWERSGENEYFFMPIVKKKIFVQNLIALTDITSKLKMVLQ
jgi:hypothetical protein